MSAPQENEMEQKDRWEQFYQENQRPWRGVGKLGNFNIEQGSKVLDIGCGNGKTTVALIQMGAEVTGIDFSPSAIEYCMKAFGDKAKFLVSDCNKLPFPDNSFDAVTIVHVLEHLVDDQLLKAVSEIGRVLIPGGKVLVRSFAIGDLRSEGKDSNVRGNGISYRYFTVEQMEDIFTGFRAIDSKCIDEPTRFGAIRVKVECVFSNLKIS